MAKHATKRGAVVAHPSATRRVRLGEVLVQARTALREIVVGAGFQVLTAMLEEDREALCGPRYQQGEKRQAYRHGSEEASVVLGGRKVRVKKLRVRSTEGSELALPTWQDVTREDPLEERGGIARSAGEHQRVDPVLGHQPPRFLHAAAPFLARDRHDAVAHRLQGGDRWRGLGEGLVGTREAEGAGRHGAGGEERATGEHGRRTL